MLFCYTFWFLCYIYREMHKKSCRLLNRLATSLIISLFCFFIYILYIITDFYCSQSIFYHTALREMSGSSDRDVDWLKINSLMKTKFFICLTVWAWYQIVNLTVLHRYNMQCVTRHSANLFDNKSKFDCFAPL
jgi:hypothetical protein